MIIILLMGFLNAMRGSGFLPRYLWIAEMWVAICAYTYFTDVLSITQAVLLLPALFLGFAPGWGTYFNAAYGDSTYSGEKEVAVIDWLTDKIYGKPTTTHQFEQWCTIAMSLRGLFFYPIFVILGSPVIGLGVALMGVIYWARRFIPEENSIRVTEVIFGGWLGFLIYL